MFQIDDSFFYSPKTDTKSEQNPNSKHKITQEWYSSSPQTYNGEIFHGNIHGHGFYFMDKEEKLFYDGLFYMNKLEGYSQVFYYDSSNFQGLFKDNKRFGPGVFTYPNGEQDVGLWNGKYMIRLGGTYENIWVPNLARTPKGQMKLLKYRYLVPVNIRRREVAFEILKSLGANERVLRQADELYNLDIQNKHSLFFNKNRFDEQFHSDMDCYIDVPLSDGEEPPEQVPETPCEKIDMNQKRIDQINEQLKIMETKLESFKKHKDVVERKVEHCKACCNYELQTEGSAVLLNVIYGEGDKEDVPVLHSPTASNDGHIEDTANKITSGEEDSDFDYLDHDFFPPNDNSDVICQIKSYLSNSCNCDEVEIGDLCDLEKELEKTSQDVIFFECITNNLTQKLERHQEKISAQSNSTLVETKKVIVRDLLAWNNEEKCLLMLKHSFLHRKSEYMINFEVSDILAGNRRRFGEPGTHEKNCVDFLAACFWGDKKAIFKYVGEDTVNLNVCDARGNNGIFFASANRHVDALKVLVNLGVNLDRENDEQLTPLSLCLLQFIAEKYQITDWETSFLEDVEPPERQQAYKWYPCSSLLKLIKTKEFTQSTKSTEDVKPNEKTPYIFDVKCFTPSEEEIETLKKQRRSSIMKSKSVSMGLGDDFAKKTTEEVIKTLLDCGANPNAGEVPLPPLFLSLFTENPNLVECMLVAGANVEVTIPEDLTVLHIIASLKCCQANADICSLLLSNCSNARLRAAPSHWSDQKSYILGKSINVDEVEDLGKNALHILCMRRDYALDICNYFEQMTTIFANSLLANVEDKYLGHTPLSLAVLVGNKSVVETLLKFEAVDPHRLLDNNMGNVLTVYILKRYEDLIPANAKEIMQSLVQQGANPLQQIGEFQNAIAFMEKEHEKSKGRKSKQLTDVKQTKRPSIKTGKGKGKKVSQRILKDMLVELARDTIIKCVQLYTVENLYNLIEDDLAHHPCVKILVAYLTPELIIDNLQILFKNNRLQFIRFDKQICLKLIDIAKQIKNETDAKETSHTRKDTGKAKLNSKNTKKKTDWQEKIVETKPLDYNVLLDNTDFSSITESINYDLIPGLDNLSKYKVCFNCLMKKDKLLLVCPKCQSIYFCSEQCNKTNLKLSSKHPCNIDFYASEQRRLQKPDVHQLLDYTELFRKVRENCKIRIANKIKKRMEREKKRIEEEKKQYVDMRKTKTLQEKTPTNRSLCGSGTELVTVCSSEEIFSERKLFTGSSSYSFFGFEKPKLKPKISKGSDVCPSTKRSHVVTTKSSKTSSKDDKCKQTDICYCMECLKEKPEEKLKCSSIKYNAAKKKVANKSKVNLRKASPEVEVAIRRLREIPSRYREFMELLTTYFPEVDFTSMLLPYACYSNGHLYYKFFDKDIYSRTYSMI